MKTKNKLILKRWVKNNLPKLSLFTREEKTNLKILVKKLTNRKAIYNHLIVSENCFKSNKKNNNYLIKIE